MLISVIRKYRILPLVATGNTEKQKYATAGNVCPFENRESPASAHDSKKRHTLIDGDSQSPRSGQTEVLNTGKELPWVSWRLLIYWTDWGGVQTQCSICCSGSKKCADLHTLNWTTCPQMHGQSSQLHWSRLSSLPASKGQMTVI